MLHHAFVVLLMQHAFVLGLMQHDFVLGLMQHAFVLARIRLTRTAAERGPVLSGERGQMSEFQTVHARVLRVRAPTVSTGSSVSGV